MAQEEKKQNNNEEVVISLDQFAVPGAIILAGILIAVAIFFTNKNKDTSSTDNSGDDTTTGDDSTDAYSFDDASVNIGDGLVLGDKDTATVAIVEFSDYLCSYCQRHVEETLDSLISNYVDSGDVIYVFKDFAIHGDVAEAIAMGGRCVYEKSGIDKFLEYHKSAFMLEDNNAVYDLAQEIGLDRTTIQNCVENGTYSDAIDADYSAGEEAGITGTPGFVVGTIDEDGNVTGKLIAGAYPYEAFVEVLDSLLAE